MCHAFKPQASSLKPQASSLKQHSVALITIGLLFGATAQAATLYKITDLGDLPGGDSYSIANAINDQGQVVGYSDTAFNSQFGDDGYHGFIWDTQNGLRDLGIFSNQRMGYASDINESGTVVGLRAGTGSTFFRGFEWTALSGVVDLGVSGAYPYSEARTVNDTGYIVENNWSFSGPPSSVYLRSPSGSRSNIGNAAGISNPIGTDINNTNQIVGNDYLGANAYRWDPATGMTVITPFTGGTVAHAMSINESGTVVGNSTITGGAYHPFIWDSISGIHDLGVLNATQPDGAAYGINDANAVVGYSLITANTAHAFLWDSSNGLRDLNNLLLDSTGWQYLASASAINNVGQIVGYGILTNGNTHAFILDPLNVPEPAPLPLMAVGMAGLLFRHRPKVKLR